MPEFTAAEMVFDVDFNNAVEGGRLIKASARRSPGRVPEAGERIFLRDAEGNTCWVRVDRIDGR